MPQKGLAPVRPPMQLLPLPLRHPLIAACHPSATLRLRRLPSASEPVAGDSTAKTEPLSASAVQRRRSVATLRCGSLFWRAQDAVASSCARRVMPLAQGTSALRPNPSVNARPNGRPPGPRCALVYPAPRGPGVLPSGPRYLER